MENTTDQLRTIDDKSWHYLYIPGHRDNKHTRHAASRYYIHSYLPNLCNCHCIDEL